MNDRQSTALALFAVAVAGAGVALYAAYARSLATSGVPAFANDITGRLSDGWFDAWDTAINADAWEFSDAIPAPVSDLVPASEEISQSLAGAFNYVADAAADVADGALMTVGFSLPGRWVTVAQKPENAAYLNAAQAAERANGIPDNIIVRLIYQECRYRADIIYGPPNSAGAQGICQIIPRWNPGVDPKDPIASIKYAGKKLAGLYRMFGDWGLALQAYNWGEGNLQKFLNGTLKTKSGALVTRLPTETANYSSQILADVGVASGVFV